uniref:Uncharacterized protein n=1 Tax=Oryza sativa subsp. indica TaxID=39946 RepID=A0MLV1_ORYSI|nr:hypothetical protein [Oryza sativa Indica Group]
MDLHNQQPDALTDEDATVVVEERCTVPVKLIKRDINFSVAGVVLRVIFSHIKLGLIRSEWSLKMDCNMNNTICQDSFMMPAVLSMPCFPKVICTMVIAGGGKLCQRPKASKGVPFSPAADNRQHINIFAGGRHKVAVIKETNPLRLPFKGYQ